jgi:putative tryptophan/tyrosine transport system substrate-binding protein
LKRVAYLYNATDDIDSEFRGAEAAGKKLGIIPIRFPVRVAEDFAATFEKISRQNCQALYISVSGFTNFHRQRLAGLALKHHLPSINGFPEYPEAGGLISYGASLVDGFKRAAYFTDRIMKGASPKDLPVEEPTKFYLFVNAKTAKKLGIKIPNLIIVQADKVIE